MDADAGQVLLVVGTNPPMTSGDRTRARCALAATLLGFGSYRLGNLVSIPTRDVLDLSSLAGNRDAWTDARPLLEESLGVAHGVLLAYGVSEPSGTARSYFRDQVAWLFVTVKRVGVPTWQVGDRPRHPSRWQRHTSRVSPGMPFPEALGSAFTRLS